MANQGGETGHEIFSLEVVAERWRQPNGRGKQGEGAAAIREVRNFN